MIDFKTWLPQILGYCEFVTDDVKLRQAWINRDFSETSVTDFDELYEQVFDDLDADRFAAKLYLHLPNVEHASNAIAAFLSSLKNIDRARIKNPELRDASALLESDEWKLVRMAALTMMDAVDYHPGEEREQ